MFFRAMSPAKSEEKRLFSQARPAHLYMKTDIAKTNITNDRPNVNKIEITVTM